MISVRFERPWSLYNSGEVAGFDAETAGALVEGGVATEVREGPVAAPAAPQSRPRRRAPRTDRAG